MAVYSSFWRAEDAATTLPALSLLARAIGRPGELLGPHGAREGGAWTFAVRTSMARIIGGAHLQGVHLSGVRCNSATRWPRGFVHPRCQP